MSHPKLNTIAAIEIMQGEVDGDFDSLEEILLNNYSNRLSDNPTSSRYEDTNCPSSSIVDNGVVTNLSILISIFGGIC